MRRTINAVFETPLAADRAVDALVASDVDADRISMLMNDTIQSRHCAVTTPDTTVAGMKVGAVAGGIIALAAAAHGGFVVGGPLAALFGGAALGTAGGGLMGALINLGIPKEQAQKYHERLDRGGVLVAVDCDDADQAADARAILIRAGDTAPYEAIRTTSLETATA